MGEMQRWRKKQKRKLQAGSSDCWERDFFGSIVKALVSWQGQDARVLGAKCSSANTLPLVEGNSARVTASLAILCVQFTCKGR